MGSPVCPREQPVGYANLHLGEVSYQPTTKHNGPTCTMELPQLRYPVSDKISRWVCLHIDDVNHSVPHYSKRTYLQALRVRIEYSEIWTRVYPGARTPLPPAIIRGEITINQLLHEILCMVIILVNNQTPRIADIGVPARRPSNQS